MSRTHDDNAEEAQKVYDTISPSELWHAQPSIGGSISGETVQSTTTITPGPTQTWSYEGAEVSGNDYGQFFFNDPNYIDPTILNRNAGTSGSPQDVDEHFVPGVLGRQEGHHESLGLYTAELVDRLGEKYSSLDLPVRGFVSSLDDENATIVSPQPLRTIHAPKGDGEDDTRPYVRSLADDVQYMVFEETPVNA
jgi:hypothetical protein